MDNVEITEEMLDDAVTCNVRKCENCRVRNGKTHCIIPLANEIRRLREERKNNPGVWDFAPDEAEKACVIYTHGKLEIHCGKYNNYTRQLPKTRARQIAEESAKKYHGTDELPKALADTIEAAILEYTKETK